VSCNLTSKLNKSTKRELYGMEHYKFRTRLQEKCVEHGCKFNIIPESYTSKTCTNCGNIKNDLGGNKIYKCSKCGMVLDRDVNGARNIYIKHTTLVSAL